MIKLEKDEKSIKNIKLSKIEKYKIITATNLVITATILSAPYINFKKVEVSQYNYYDEVTTGINRPKVMTISYEDYILDENADKIIKYAQIYNLNEEFVLKIVKDNLKNYNTIFVTKEEYESSDIYIILLCRDIIRNTENYTDDFDSIKGNDNYVSDLSIREIVYKYADLFDIDRTFALTIACGESGYFTKPIATEKNNPYAMQGQDGFYDFENLEKGILEGIANLKFNYIDYDLTTYEDLNNVYCTDGSDWENFMINVEKNVLDGYVLYDEEKSAKTYVLN